MNNLNYKGYFIQKIKLEDETKVTIFSNETMENIIDKFIVNIPNLTDEEIDERIKMYIDEVI